MKTIGLRIRGARRALSVTGAMALILACNPRLTATPTVPAVPTAAPTATPAASSSTSSPTTIPTAEATSWRRVFTVESGSLGNVIAGSWGLVSAGCIAGADGDCARRIVVVSRNTDDWQELEIDGPPDISFGSLRRVGDRLFSLGYGHYGPAGGAVIHTSVDGRSWTRVESTSFPSRAVDDIIESPVGTFAIGYEAPIDSDNTSGFVVWPVRADGTFGTARVVKLPSGPALVSSGTWAGNEFLAWGVRDGPSGVGPTILLASPDGKAWTVRGEVSAPQGADVRQIVLVGDVLVAVGYEGRTFPIAPRAWTSTDGGESWSLATVPSDNAAMDAVAIERSVLIARGTAFSESGDQRQAVSWRSRDGTAWTRFADDEDLPSVPGFSAHVSARLGDQTCVAGTVLADTSSSGAIYCRPTVDE
jgi:hypothetical protein